MSGVFHWVAHRYPHRTSERPAWWQAPLLSVRQIQTESSHGQTPSRRRSRDFGSSVSTAFRILAQDVFQAYGVKDTQTPFFQRNGVAGSDAISGPSGQHTEPALQ